MRYNREKVKSILPSKRANLFYLEHCRIMVKDGVVIYLTSKKDVEQFWNVPDANTIALLLGPGTSITNSAVRLLTTSGVIIGFTGGEGTPLYGGIEWVTSHSEYRPTEYIQKWLSFWYDKDKRLTVAKELLKTRYKIFKDIISKDSFFKEYEIFVDDINFTKLDNSVNNAINIQNLLNIEAENTKKLYKFMAELFNINGGVFKREHKSNESVNGFLNHGNYMAYGLASSVLWSLGIPYGFPILHGKTRRGGLVFDIADLIKDSIVLPLSFIADFENYQTRNFRQLLLEKFTEHKAMDKMFNFTEYICHKYGREIE